MVSICINSALEVSALPLRIQGARVTTRHCWMVHAGAMAAHSVQAALSLSRRMTSSSTVYRARPPPGPGHRYECAILRLRRRIHGKVVLLKVGCVLMQIFNVKRICASINGADIECGSCVYKKRNQNQNHAQDLSRGDAAFHCSPKPSCGDRV